MIYAKCTSCGDIVGIEPDATKMQTCSAPCGKLKMMPSKEEGISITGNWCNPTDRDLELIAENK